MDPFKPMSSSNPPPAPVSTREVGQGSGTAQPQPHHSGSPSITGYTDLARFDPFEIDFIDSPPPPIPGVPNDPTAPPVMESNIDAGFSTEELNNYLSSDNNMPLRSPGGDDLRSLSMDSDFLDYIADVEGFPRAVEDIAGSNDAVPEIPVQHQVQSVCMGGSDNVTIEAEPSSVANEMMKKVMPPEKLAELAVVDPKRAKRILANRESAARSKEKRTRYTMELEEKAQTLQAQSAKVSAQLAKLEKENSDLKAQNKDINCETVTIEAETKLRRELNESLRAQLTQLKKEHRRKTAFKSKNFQGLLSQFSSQLALFQVTHLRSWQAQQHQQQLGMPSSHLDKPNNEQVDSDDDSN
ncbi:transcription factor VIP1-like [Prosopis cineraria]|uniref:transcription factor VIP1-like n=1 Tax=Prosopis cineraria TaxID=364024 RepID=UPI0024109A25|nr:transcription factor VIP1-like [Prosopis cineraria]